ncbi:hypothetical protein BD626DRAFT_506715 [Schizophyllum amplum]|uniref:F-box domain-containing protein n=1 Tax=Schizophyllum amplum TaxID=97359 RepID=A0A550C4Z1_9AGAR|nr:hypothetical protein BD626DRAFT_506715 [Auriculariopsis ampla]
MRLCIAPETWWHSAAGASPLAIMVFMHVCSGWRASGPDATRQIHAWFRRARPMTVSLYIASPSHPTRQLLKHDLGSLTHQISGLSVYCPLEMLADFLHLPPNVFPALEKLDLSFGWDSLSAVAPRMHHGLTIFKEARLLRTLFLAGVYHLRTGALSTEIPIDWARLEELELRHRGPKDRHAIPDLFRQCTRLRRAVLDLTNAKALQPIPNHIIDFPFLVLLEITFKVWPAALMDASRFRHLKELTLASDVRLTDTNLSKLGPHMPQLGKLVLRNVDLFDWENEFDGFLANIYCLREIVFFDAKLSPRAIFPAFGDRAARGGGTLVPHLEKLSFDNIDIGVEDEDLENYTDAFGLIVDILGTRLESTPLCDCYLSWSWRYKFDTIPLYGHAKYTIRLLQGLIDAYPALSIAIEDLEEFVERIQTGAIEPPIRREDYDTESD